MANVQPFPIDIYIDIELPKEFYIYREIYIYRYIRLNVDNRESTVKIVENIKEDQYDKGINSIRFSY